MIVSSVTANGANHQKNNPLTRYMEINYKFIVSAA
jgi:hypothetical protein